jgi:hypothetical protein
MKKIIIKLWLVLDPLYYRLTRLTYIGHYKKHTSNIFRVRLTKYKGRNVVLEDGTYIKKNDILVKIHLHNVRILNNLYDIKSDVRKAFLIYQMVKESMPGLAMYILTHKRFPEIKGIVGITSLNKGIKKLGFEPVSISNPIYKWMKIIIFLPIHLLSLVEPKPHRIWKQPEPKYIFISKKKLISMYTKPPMEETNHSANKQTNIIS